MEFVSLSELPKAKRGGAGRGPSKETLAIQEQIATKKPVLVPTDEPKKMAAKIRAAGQKADLKVSVRITDEGVAFQGQ